VEPDLLKIFELGNMLHEFIVKVLKSEKNEEVEVVNEELPVEVNLGEFVISGRIDSLIVIKELGEKVILEVKSCSNVNKIEKPYTEHLMQVQIYMHLLGFKRAILLYIDKRNLKTRAFYVDYDEEWAKMIMERFYILHEHLKKDVPPPPEGKMLGFSYMCERCAYKDVCSKEKYNSDEQ
jgi:CRISPR/Cas system-associated exonuclease Cas4 (RecB family)